MSMAFVQGNDWSPVNSLHKWLVTRKMFPFNDDVIMDIDVVGWNAYWKQFLTRPAVNMTMNKIDI